jgi:hypothetical protein
MNEIEVFLPKRQNNINHNRNFIIVYGVGLTIAFFIVGFFFPTKRMTMNTFYIALFLTPLIIILRIKLTKYVTEICIDYQNNTIKIDYYKGIIMRKYSEQNQIKNIKYFYKESPNKNADSTYLTIEFPNGMLFNISEDEDGYNKNNLKIISDVFKKFNCRLLK